MWDASMGVRALLIDGNEAIQSNRFPGGCFKVFGATARVDVQERGVPFLQRTRGVVKTDLNVLVLCDHGFEDVVKFAGNGDVSWCFGVHGFALVLAARLTADTDCRKVGVMAKRESPSAPGQERSRLSTGRKCARCRLKSCRAYRFSGAVVTMIGAGTRSRGGVYRFVEG